MKSLIFLIFVLLIFPGCKKAGITDTKNEPPLSAKNEYVSLPEAYYPPRDSTSQYLNFFQKGEDLFFQESRVDSAIYLTKILGSNVRVSWNRGFKNLFCICAYGGSVLPGGGLLYIYNKNIVYYLHSPADSLVFSNIKTNGTNIIIELVSMKSWLENLNGNSQPINPEKLRLYYGRYSPIDNTLKMD